MKEDKLNHKPFLIKNKFAEKYKIINIILNALWWLLITLAESQKSVNKIAKYSNTSKFFIFPQFLLNAFFND